MKTYQVRGYWHSDGAEFQATFSEARSNTSMHVMDKAELLCLLNKNQYGYSYYHPDTYKKSFTILKVAKNYDD